MKNRFMVRVLSLLAAFVLACVCVPKDKVFATNEYVIIEDEEIPLNNMENEENGNIAVILAGMSCVLTIGAAFIWLRSEKKRVVEEEE